MLVVSFFTWWYSDAWLKQINAVTDSLSRVADSFSLITLLKTMFAPFRQISAQSSKGPLSVVLRAVVDKLISRMIGAMVRFFTFLAGALVWLITAAVGLVRIIVWPFLPLLPLLCVYFAVNGWVPSWI